MTFLYIELEEVLSTQFEGSRISFICLFINLRLDETY
jgi:hypothetical protein